MSTCAWCNQEATHQKLVEAALVRKHRGKAKATHVTAARYAPCCQHHYNTLPEAPSRENVNASKTTAARAWKDRQERLCG